MAITNNQFLQGLYVAYWGRAADPSGFYYWDNKVGDLGYAGIAENFASSAEGKAAYAYFNAYYTLGPAAITDAMRYAFIDQIYANLFERAPDAVGREYWFDQLKGGESSPGRFIADIVNAAYENREGESADDWATMHMKMQAAEYFTDQLVENNVDWTQELSDEFEAVLAGVDKDSDLAAVKAQADAIVQGGENPGQTFTLTDGIDNIVGTAGNDTILAGTENTNPTLNPGDQIDGKAGTDTLKIYAGAANFGTASIKNVDIVEVYEDAALDVSANADVQQVWSYGGVGKAITATVDQVIGFGNQATGGNSTATFANVTGTADASTIAVKDAGKTTAYTSITVAGIEALTVDASGKNQIGNLIADKAETIAFTGDGTVKATLFPGTTVLKSVDASENTGGVEVSLTDAQFGANEIKVTGGTGDDKITFTDALGAKATIDLGEGKNTLRIIQGSTALTAGSTFKGGSGTEDTLVLDTTTVVNATNGKMFTGFENIVLNGASTFQVGHIAGITGFEIASSAATNATITKLAEASTVKVSATSTGMQTLTLADNSAATASVNVVLDNGQSGKAAAAGVSTIIDTNAHVLNVESAGNVNATPNKLALTGATASLAQVTNIVVTGDQAANVITSAATALTLIDASDATGKQTINADTATKSMTIKGGSAADTISATDVLNAVSTIIGGEGADTITLGVTPANNQGDVIRLTGQADSTAAGFDVITNFAGGTIPANADKLDLAAFGFTGAQADFFTLGAPMVTVTGNGATATFSIADAQASNFFANAGVDKGVALYTTATESFAFIDADKNGDWNVETDSVILLAGNYSAGILVAGNFIFA